MDLDDVRTIYLKELRDILRDRRTLIAMILVPILVFPLIIGGTGAFMLSQIRKTERAPSRICVEGLRRSSDLYVLLSGEPGLRVVDLPEPMDALSEGRIDAVLRVDGDLDGGVGSGERPRCIIFYDSAELRSESAKRKIEQVLSGYSSGLVSAELARRGIDSGILEPFEIERKNIAPEEKIGGSILGGILPYIFIFLMITGAMYPAIDLTAGEKERGTMETLLSSPAGRLEITLGKFLTVLSASMFTAILGIMSMFTAIRIGVAFIPQISGRFVQYNLPLISSIVLIMLPLACFFSALLISIAILARSYREAQSYISPLMIAVLLPLIIAMGPGIKLDMRLAIVPVLNVSLLFREFLVGEYEWKYIGTVFLSSLAYASAALYIAVVAFRREEVLFRI